LLTTDLSTLKVSISIHENIKLIEISSESAILNHALFTAKFSSFISQISTLSARIIEAYDGIFRFLVYNDDFAQERLNFHEKSSSERFVISIRSVVHSR
jgi:hypothetical protein